ncbi:MAG: hypothetical protein DIZ80_12970 [endosymbiont of Galathealinum brachiosum]|uniref:Glycosyl hydrolase-like 10 domain-containing protein n=1 Tax=endosymbiont of Galathealinum brachiosum TaxID=2200906 RepID=A0A370D7V6_9GAMM|nr:MAG: hypothetical protein DIZ80_12970 [endosymbiont of Galathealinum brachiosum]
MFVRILKKCIYLLLLVLPEAAVSIPLPIMTLDFDRGENLDEFNSLNNSDESDLRYVDGLIGKGLALKKECISLKLKKTLESENGSFSMWLKPDWDYYKNNDGKLISHSFMSMKWSDGSYLVLSDGWWEKSGGSQFTYFIFNNKKYNHTHGKIIYKKNQWVNLAVTWNKTAKQINLYKNGKLISSREKTIGSGNYANELIIGCDKGTSLFASRWVDAVIDDVKIYNVTLSENEVLKSIGISKNKIDNIEHAFLNENKGTIAHDEKAPENRVMFDSYPASWQTREQALKTVKKLYESGINVYIPCVWYGDGARFNSNVAPFASYKGKGEPLRYLIEVAHEFGIEVHPWVTVTYRSKKFLKNFYDKGTPPKAFDVQNIKFRDFIVEFITDLVKRYDVDGVNLDYIRTMGISKSIKSKNKFLKKYNKALLSEIKDIDGNHAWNNNVQDFVNNPIDDIVIRLSKNIRSIKPKVIISVDAHPKPLFLGQSRQGRNAIKWLNKGLIDVIYTMNYKSDFDFMNVDLVKREVDDPEKVVVLMGVSEKDGKVVSTRASNKVEKLVRFSRSKWDSGVAFYPYSKVTDELHSLFKNKLFKHNVKTKWPD